MCICLYSSRYTWCGIDIQENILWFRLRDSHGPHRATEALGALGALEALGPP